MTSTDLTWITLSIVATWGAAAMHLVNQYAKLDGLTLTFFNKAIMIGLSLPFALWFGLPKEPLYYLFVFLTVPCAIISDTAILNTSARFGGGVVSRIIPFHLIIVFLIWLTINPSLLAGYFDNPTILTGILLSLLGSAFFTSRLRRCSVNREAFKSLIPAVIGSTGIIIFNKLSMNHSSLHEGVFSYAFVQSLMIVFIGVIWRSKQIKKNLRVAISPLLIKASIFIASTTFIHSVTKNYAFKLVDDPTFPSAIILTSPLWVLLFYKLTKHKETVDIFSGLGLVFSVLALTLFKTM